MLLLWFQKLRNCMNEELITCPACECPYGYYMNDTQCICPECQHEWNPSLTGSDKIIALDANGTALSDGDSVTVIKDLPVKGAPKSIKAGTKVKNIRLKNGDHNIDCKIDGFGAMALKSEFVLKA